MSDLLFSFRGRLNRKPFWLATLVLVLILIVLVFALIALGGIGLITGDLTQIGTGALVLLLAYIPLLWVSLAICAKRLHDRNKSAAWLLLFWLVPAVLQGVGEVMQGNAGIALTVIGAAISIWALVELGFLRGTVGPNQYGPDPLEGKV
jgi:uncharacterized membrane protein YhaH (DUF805 family)